MSLATTGGGGFSAGGAGGGGMAMAHHADAVARPAPPTQHKPPPGSSGFGGAGAPPSAAALGADLLDKDQSLSLRQVRNLSRLPLVAVDLFGSDKRVTMFPPKSTQEPPPKPSSVGKLRALTLQSNEASHKTLRKWLSKSKGYEAVRTTSLSANDEGVTVVQPQQLLGVRRLQDVPSHVRESYPTVDDDSSPAIAEDALAGSVGITVANGTMDGRTPTGDDYDRVVFRVRLHESKKAVTVLPEEAVSLILAEARFKVAQHGKSEEEDEEIMEYPVALAVPAWACNDAAMEALLDATEGTGVLLQRGIAACAGALLPGPEGSANTLLNRLSQVRAKKQKAFQKEHPDDTAEFEYAALLLLVGLTSDGVECTAIQVSDLQPSCMSCLFGNFKVLANVSYPHKDPISIVVKCVDEIRINLEEIAPEADGPVAFVTYGTPSEQGETKKQLGPSALRSWEKVPFFSTKPECVAVGTAILGAVSHGRLATLTQGANGKPKAQLALRVQNVAPTAVGIRMNYQGGASKNWTPVKVIFDFDRRVPAGPYPIDLNAAECAAHRNATKPLSPEDLLETVKQYEGSKGIPQREDAALKFRLQVMQQWRRDGEWMPVGNPISPLSNPDPEDEEIRIACESAVLELSLGAAGIITSSLTGDGKSVVQATKSARNSKLRYYISCLLAAAFFGGFLIKSYWEEKVFDRDTERLMAYYKHVIPGSFQDGDIHNARYLVWKYRGKKNKLWKRLETKYGEPVRHAWEWEDDVADDAEEEVVENLDEKEEENSSQGESDKGRQTEEPDL